MVTVILQVNLYRVLTSQLKSHESSNVGTDCIDAQHKDNFHHSHDNNPPPPPAVDDRQRYY